MVWLCAVHIIFTCVSTQITWPIIWSTLNPRLDCHGHRCVGHGAVVVLYYWCLLYYREKLIKVSMRWRRAARWQWIFESTTICSCDTKSDLHLGKAPLRASTRRHHWMKVPVMRPWRFAECWSGYRRGAREVGLRLWSCLKLVHLSPPFTLILFKSLA